MRPSEKHLKMPYLSRSFSALAASTVSDIYIRKNEDLEVLSEISSVEGDLLIMNCDDLIGIGSVKSVSGSLFISRCPNFDCSSLLDVDVGRKLLVNGKCLKGKNLERHLAEKDNMRANPTEIAGLTRERSF